VAITESFTLVFTFVTSVAVGASTVANADCDCSTGDDRGVANVVGDDAVNIRL